ncbi:MAG: GNAT family N-acetyltransferase [Acidobacteriota bacterium]|nr:GNAT family N-acetyltransferase [Acidobacteriota bacterium]
MAELLIRHFGYYYTAAFGAGGALTLRVFKDILLVNGGKHPLGYEAFYIAREQTTREIVGCLLFHTRESCTPLKNITSAVGSAFVVLRHLGVVGLMRTFRNLRTLGTELPALGPDELQIVYLAVSPAMRGKHVGTRLVEHIRNAPGGQNKGVLRLEVRESNEVARQFFGSLGFAEDGLKTSPGDAILGRGARVQMTRIAR